MEPQLPCAADDLRSKGPPALKVGRPQEIGDDRLGAEAGTGAGVALAICHHDDLSLEARITANPNPTDISPGALNRINTESTTNEICPHWLI